MHSIKIGSDSWYKMSLISLYQPAIGWKIKDDYFKDTFLSNEFMMNYQIVDL